MSKNKQLATLLLIGDFVVLYVLYHIAQFNNVSILRYSFMYFMLGFIFGSYDCGTNLIWDDAKKIALQHITFFLATNVMNSLHEWTMGYLLSNLGVSIVMSIFSLLYSRYLRILLRKYLAQKILIIGTGPHASMIYDRYRGNRYALSNVVGIVDCNGSKRVPGIQQVNTFEDMGLGIPFFNYDQIDKAIEELRVDEAVIAMTNLNREQTQGIAEDLMDKVKVVKTIPKVNSLMTFSSKVEDFDGVLLLSTASGKTDAFGKFLKRALDICGGLVGVIFLFPIAMIVKIINVSTGDTAPMFFVQERIGLHGKPFKMYKFRSMIPNAEKKLEELMQADPAIREEYLTNKKLQDDPRITKAGKFLRKTSLDEFPQLFNVLKGEMSLVGPRPYLFGEKEDMGKYYKEIIECKPALTGMWQTHGRSEVSFNDRCRLDSYYYRNWTFWLDFTILIRTAKTVFGKFGAM